MKTAEECQIECTNDLALSNNKDIVISFTEFAKALKEHDNEIIVMIKKVFDDYEYDDEDFIITPHLECIEMLLQNKLKNKIKD